MRVCRAAGFAVISLAACRGDVTAPDPGIAGTWAYTASSLQEQGSAGSIGRITGLALGLTGPRTAFGGVTSGWTLTLANSTTGKETTGSLPSGPIVNGRASGDSVEFDIGNSDFHSAGRVVGDSIAGITTFIIRSSSGSHVFIGGFIALRAK